jgi:hypothetical protein
LPVSLKSIQNYWPARLTENEKTRVCVIGCRVRGVMDVSE